MVKNPPCNARDMGLISGLGTKIPYATENQEQETQRLSLEKRPFVGDILCIPAVQGPSSLDKLYTQGVSPMRAACVLLL